MTDILEGRYRPSADTSESAVGNETVLLHLKSGTYFGLDPVGTRIWGLLKAGSPPRSICDQVAAEYGITPEVVEADTMRFLTQLRDNDIIVEET